MGKKTMTKTFWHLHFRSTRGWSEVDDQWDFTETMRRKRAIIEKIKMLHIDCMVQKFQNESWDLLTHITGLSGLHTTRSLTSEREEGQLQLFMRCDNLECDTSKVTMEQMMRQEHNLTSIHKLCVAVWPQEFHNQISSESNVIMLNKQRHVHLLCLLQQHAQSCLDV